MIIPFVHTAVVGPNALLAPGTTGTTGTQIHKPSLPIFSLDTLMTVWHDGLFQVEPSACPLCTSGSCIPEGGHQQQQNQSVNAHNPRYL